MEVIRVIKSTSKIKSIKSIGRGPSYDFTVKDTHRILANGFYTSNCNHPEIETFIHLKRDRTRVTGANISIRVTDDFMHAVENDTEFTLQWPVDVPVEEAKITKVVRAKDVYEQLVDAGWDSAEPGILFWDAIINNGIADVYKDYGFETISTNPCLTGDTLVAVADGRGSVSFKQLADEGSDVPVYTSDESGNVVIRTMRNPRCTGVSVPVMKVTIEGGHSFKATPNHKLPLLDGRTVEVKDLQPGDQLQIMKRVDRRLVELNPKIRTQNKNQYIVIENRNKAKSEHRMIWEFYNGKVKLGNVIHHIDFNSKNNKIDNLQSLPYKQHINIHRVNMLGGKNPMRRAQTEWSEEKWQSYHDNMSKVISGVNNGMSYDVSNEELFKHAVLLAKQQGIRFSCWSWVDYAKANNLPQFLVEYRFGKYKTFEEWAIAASIFAGVNIDIVNFDPRIQKSIIDAKSQGYDIQIEDNDIKVKRVCEWCKKEFYVSFSSREKSFCDSSCSNRYQYKINSAKIINTVNQTHAKKAQETRKQQLDIYTNLRFELGKEPKCDDWIAACKRSDVPFRTGTKYGFKSWKDLKAHAALHNHRIVSIENTGFENVYNGTVDQFHTFFMGGWECENNEQLFVSSLNCGEIPLSRHDACRLLAIDLTHFVDGAFTSNPTFDFEKFDECSQIGQRLLDDIIDLEIEAIDKIIGKIESDPESESVKTIELELWKKIRQSNVNGRRTGLGPTGLGDALAMLNVRYGSEESIEWTDKIYRALALASYRSSVKMAEERGPFVVYDYELEHQHPFIQRIMSQDSELAERYKKFGRRNIANTTTAPVGSLSTLTQTTSGIEPAFMLSYTRRKKQNPNDIDSKVDFVDAMGDKWTNHTVYHHAFKQWMDVTGKTDVKDSPYHKALSNDIDWMMTVKLQATAQKWICHSISKTVNLPQNASHDLVSQVYLEAWKSGCKGITVYRDKSRDGVLVSDDGKVQIDIPGRYDAVPDAEIEKMLGIGEKYFRNMPSGYKTTLKQIKEYYESRKNPKPVQERSLVEENHALKRHKELLCDIKQVKIAGESWTILVGLLNGKPYEVFGGLSSLVEVSKKIKQGILVKNGKKDGITSYNLKITVGEDDFVFKDIVQLFDNPTQGALTRMLSLLLRHNVPVQYIVEQLQKDKYSDMTSFARVIARVLKAYIPDGVKSTSEKKCDVCGAEGTLIYQEGCVKCSACGNSRCG